MVFCIWEPMIFPLVHTYHHHHHPQHAHTMKPDDLKQAFLFFKVHQYMMYVSCFA